MSIKTAIAATVVGALAAIPVTAGAVGATDPPEVNAPCGVDAEWMQDHWSDPRHWEEMQSFMEEHWEEMGSHMYSEEFDHGPGMTGRFGMHGWTDGRYGMWQDDGS